MDLTPLKGMSLKLINMCYFNRVSFTLAPLKRMCIKIIIMNSFKEAAYPCTIKIHFHE